MCLAKYFICSHVWYELPDYKHNKKVSFIIRPIKAQKYITYIIWKRFMLKSKTHHSKFLIFELECSLHHFENANCEMAQRFRMQPQHGLVKKPTVTETGFFIYRVRKYCS